MSPLLLEERYWLKSDGVAEPKLMKKGFESA